jgi:uncharacterized spore protein YtfJ
VYGEPVSVGSRTIIPVAKVGYLLGATSGARKAKTLEGVAGAGELARDLPVASKSQMKGRDM